MTKGLQKYLTYKHKIYNSHFIKGNDIKRRKYKTYSNILKKLIRSSRDNYYQKQFEQHSKNKPGN